MVKPKLSLATTLLLLITLAFGVVVIGYATKLRNKPAHAATTYTVTNNNDSGAGSLRQAILDANANPGADIIVFSAAMTIQPTSQLTPITDPVEINGYTGSPGGAVANTAVSPAPFNGTLTVELDGSLAGVATGLYFDVGSDGSSVRGLVINRFEFDGISIEVPNVTIAGNYIGTDTTGLVDQGNTMRGIGNSVTGDGDNLTIGGLNAADRNIISGNDEGGASPNTGDDNWTIQGNFIGLGSTGVTAIPNAQIGGSGALSLDNSNGHMVGGSTAAAKNVISGNNAMAIAPHNVSNVTIAGNYIGTTYTGIAALANGGGISIGDSDNVQIGGTTGVTVGGDCTGECNIISSNTGDGIWLGTDVTATTIEGNYIGVDISGELDRGNTQAGISLGSNANNNTIGGDTAEARNIISGNTQNGVILFQAGDNNIISGNYIGTNAAGTAALSNTQQGITVNDTDGVVIGGTSSGARNVISGNTNNGIFITASSNTSVEGNYIGTNAAGTADLGNNLSGVLLYNGSSNNTIGGTSSGARNIISGNYSSGTGNGIAIDNASNNTIAGNYIGTDYTGLSSVSNGNAGIFLLNGSANNTIGGTTSGARNIISGNANGSSTASGLTTDGGGNPAGTGNVVLGNYIGLGVDGVTEVPNDYGLGLYDSNGTTVGGTSSGARNVISGNDVSGMNVIMVSDAGINNNTIAGNYIGTDYTGTVAKGNGSAIYLNAGNGTGNIIGGTTDGARNIVSGNDDSGVSVVGAVTVQGNYVGIASDGSALGNGQLTTLRTAISVGGSGAVIGGTSSGARNYVAAQNGGTGINFNGNTPLGGSQASNIVVQGNCIGTNTSCEVESGYGNNIGINSFIDVDNVLIGGTGQGAGNVIAGNGLGIANMGFQTYTPINISILGNSIYDNSGHPLSSLGIDNFQTNDFSNWINIGVTLNDADDIDYNGNNIGTNHYLNFPEITAVTSDNGTATITYNLDINDSESGATGYRVEFFSNDSADPSGYGQGQTYLGSDTVSGDVTNRTATITLPAGVEGSKQISALTIMTDSSTDGFGHTSEFGADVEATLIPASPIPTPNSLAGTGMSVYGMVMLALTLIVSGVGLKKYVKR